MKNLILGSIIGFGFSQYISDANHDIFYKFLLKPQADFRSNMKTIRAQDKCLEPAGYVNYIKDSAFSFLHFFYYYAYEKRKLDRKYKRELCFELIENFEFVRETIDNFDYVIENINKIAKETDNDENVEGSSAYKAKIEKEMMERMKSPDENNLENIEAIKALTKDDYEMYQLKNAVMNKDDYYSSLAPEFTLSKEANKLRMIQMYQDTVRSYTNKLLGDDLANRKTEMMNKTNDFVNNKMFTRQKDDMESLHQLNKRKIKEIPELSQKYPTVKNVEKEIETLKSMFGDK